MREKICRTIGIVLYFAASFAEMLTAAADVTSAAVARLLGDSLIHDSDGDLDTTLPNVVLDPDDLMLLDVRLCDLESDGE